MLFLIIVIYLCLLVSNPFKEVTVFFCLLTCDVILTVLFCKIIILGACGFFICELFLGNFSLLCFDLFSRQA